jgi:TetR/AcrR family transcriptional regulator, cholesterol catabolism regulator
LGKQQAKPTAPADRPGTLPTYPMKEKILAEAQRLFWKYGVRTITMDDIARRLAISKKTIYQHFTDKEDIVYQVVEHHLAYEQTEYCRLAEQGLNPIQEMLIACDMMREHTDRINPSLIIDVQRYFPKAWEIFLRHKEEYIIKDMMANLQRGVEQGLYWPGIDIETMARLRMEEIQAGFDDRLWPHQKDTYIIQEQLLHHFMRGILSKKGVAVYEELTTKQVSTI